MGRDNDTSGGNTGSSPSSGHGTRGSIENERESQSQGYIIGERGSRPQGNIIGERGSPGHLTRSDMDATGGNLPSGIGPIIPSLRELFGSSGSPSAPDEPGEYLVMGAMLSCIWGTEESPLIVTKSNTSINGLPQATVKDAVAGENILGFGICHGASQGVCAYSMELEDKWENVEPVSRTEEGYEAITTNSTLLCNLTGATITPLTSGQDCSVFIELLELLNMLGIEFGELMSILEDPNASLFLEGMHEEALLFLERMINISENEINLMDLFHSTNVLDRLILEAVRKLTIAHGQSDPHTFLGIMENVIQRSGVRNGADPMFLNDYLMAVLRADSAWRVDMVANCPSHRRMEENILLLGVTANFFTQMAFLSVVNAYMRPGAGTQLVQNRGTGGNPPPTLPPLRIDNAQFGKKVGKHARDFGLDPSNPASRDIVRNNINTIHRTPDVIRQGEWAGLGKRLPNGSHAPGPARFYVKGNDVVVTDLNGNFVTILKDGVNNLRVQGSTIIWQK